MMQPTNGDVSAKETFNLLHWKCEDPQDNKFSLVHLNGNQMKFKSDTADQAKVANPRP